MTVFATYTILFLPSTFIGVGLLSWIQKCYLQGHPEKYIASLPVTATVTITLSLVILIAMYSIIKPFDSMLKRLKETGVAPTEEDRAFALTTQKKMNIITIAFTIVGFVFGNLITIAIQIAKGTIPCEFTRIIFAIIHSISFGGLATLYTINLMDLMLAKKRQLLRIRTINKSTITKTIGKTLAYMATIAVFCIVTSCVMVPYQLIYLQQTQPKADALNYYLVQTLIVFAITLVMSAIPFVMILKGISERLRINAQKIEDLAKEGKLTSGIDITITDDFGGLTSSINALMIKLSSMIANLRHQTNHVTHSAEVLSNVSTTSAAALEQMKTSFSKIDSTGSQQNTIIHDVSKDIAGMKNASAELNDFMIEQSSAMQQNSASITEMAENIKSVANMTQKADELSGILSQTSERGNILVTQAVTAITEIQKASLEVQAIIKIIQAISSQTNLLSMNAAIEAAHAGDYGAGFAVVANEVRTLASSSSKSAKDIQVHIKEMAAKIDSGVNVISQAGEAFKQIQDCVDENKQVIQTLFTAMEEQRNGAEENMRVTNTVSEGLLQAKELTHNQNEYADRITATMDSVINLTNEVATEINEGKQATANLQTAFTRIGQTIADNRLSTEKMEQNISQFTV